MDSENKKDMQRRSDDPRYSEQALREKAYLKELNKESFFKRTLGYCKLSGPAFMEAATTLGAGSFASSITLGAAFGYDMLWVPLYSFAFGLFMLALATRFVTATEVPIIEAQNKYHGKFFGSFVTGIVACFIASVIYSFGQYALGADAVSSLMKLAGFNVPPEVGWIVIFAISSPLTLLYGRGNDTKYVKIVENSMKVLILIMLLVFLAIIFTTGIDFKAMVKGLIIPTLPSGIDGIVMLIASLTAVMGVMDWVLFNNAMKSRGYSEEHERLGRFDAVFGGLLPVTLVLTFVSIAFAEVFAGKSGIPTDSNELATALVEVLPSIWVQIGFYVGIIALIISTMIGLGVVSATTFCQATGLKPDSKKWYWSALLLAPQIGLFGSFFGKPVMVVIAVAAMQSCLNWITGNSWYLLGNDTRYLGKRVIQSRIFNIGVLISITILNVVFVTFILSKIGVWPA